MNKSFKFITCALISFSVLFSASFANAKRFGSGKSSGRQNTTAIQRANDPNSAPPMQQNNQQQSNNYQQQQAPMQQPMSSQPKSKFGGMGAMLGGIAAGLGMAWLASKLGLSAEFGNMLLIIAVIMLAVMAFRMFKQRKQQVAYAGVTPHNYSDVNNSTNANANASTASNYSNNNSTSAMQSSTGASSYQPQVNHSAINSAFSPASTTNFANTNSNPSNNYPVEINNLLDDANNWFINLQQLSDSRNLQTLQTLLAPELFNVIKADLEGASMLSKTTTQNLEYALLDWRETQFEFLATIQYKAQVSEDGGMFAPINEAWTFTKDKTAGSSSLWKLDGISQLNTI
jgi:predicted lipid-binding transport protein (Tim44 family)